MEDDNQIKFDEDLARQLESDIEWKSTGNENCVTEALPDVLPLGEVVVIEDSNIQMNVDVEQAITDDTFVTKKTVFSSSAKRLIQQVNFL